MKNHFLLLTTILTAFAVTACSDIQGDLQKELDAEMKGIPKKIPSLEDPLPFEKFIYAAFNMQDPFKLDGLNLARSEPDRLKLERNRPQEPLEKYDLEKLKMVAVIAQKGELTAFIRTPDSDAGIFKVKRGAHMGQNFGIVMNVTESQLTLKEIVEDSTGEWVERTVTLPLDEQEQKK